MNEIQIILDILGKVKLNGQDKKIIGSSLYKIKEELYFNRERIQELESEITVNKAIDYR